METTELQIPGLVNALRPSALWGAARNFGLYCYKCKAARQCWTGTAKTPSFPPVIQIGSSIHPLCHRPSRVSSTSYPRERDVRSE